MSLSACNSQKVLGVFAALQRWPVEAAYFLISRNRRGQKLRRQKSDLVEESVFQSLQERW